MHQMFFPLMFTVLFVCSLTNRYDMLQENLNSYRREINSQREKIQKLTATSQKYEQIIHTMTQDLREANEKLAVVEVCQRLDQNVFMFNAAVLLAGNGTRQQNIFKL